MPVSVNQLKKYIDNNLNIIISGPSGTGKTSKVLQACKDLGLNVKYYSAPTLDPYADLVGIPVPNHDTQKVEYWRPQEIDEADVVIFDELNRSHKKVQNTVFEIIQFGSINGEKLDNLKAVVSMINPNTEGYKVDDLDIALLDRFDVQLEDTPSIDIAYFKHKFGNEVALVAKEVWDSYEQSRNSNVMDRKNKAPYLPPRRMDTIISAFVKIPEMSTISDTLPSGVNISSMELYDKLSKAMKKREENKVKNKKALESLDVPPEAQDEDLAEIITLGRDARRKSNKALVKNFMSDPTKTPESKKYLVSHMMSNVINEQVSAYRLVTQYKYIIEKGTDKDFKTMVSKWNDTKTYEFISELKNHSMSDIASQVERAFKSKK